MDLRILTKLRVVKDENNEDSIDFADKTYYNDIAIKIIEVFEVTEEYAMRWDRISSRFYGRPDLAGELFKFNEYDNPFSVNAGDIIFIPEEEGLKRNVQADTSINEFTDQEITSVTVPLRRKDVNREQFLRKKDLLLPPSFAKTPSKRRNNNGTITLAD